MMQIPTIEESREAKKAILAKSAPLKKKLEDLKKKIAYLEECAAKGCAQSKVQLASLEALYSGKGNKKKEQKKVF